MAGRMSAASRFATSPEGISPLFAEHPGKGIVRHPPKRRRIKTVMQESIYFAGGMLATGRRLALRLRRHGAGHAAAYRCAYKERVADG